MWGCLDWGWGVWVKQGTRAYREAMLTMLVEPLVVAMGCSRGTMKGETATDSCVCWEGAIGRVVGESRANFL